MKAIKTVAIASIAFISEATLAFPGHLDNGAKSDVVYNTPDNSGEQNSETNVIKRLTEKDYIEVAKELGIETAAIKAVVEIETGKTHQGFHAPGQPLVNFDLKMFRRFAKRNGINLTGYQNSHPVVFSVPNTRKYGSYQAAQQARLAAAREIDEKSAVEGSFWGMFQIGGFNWQKCGVKDIDEFVSRMSMSEREQLELFVQFVKSTGLVDHLKKKNWTAFARGYNGASYAKYGYHTRLASAYAKYKQEEKTKTDK